MLGRLSSLELHHIFPKAKLYADEYELSQVNALANFTFLTKETNLHVSDRDPAEYLAVYDKKGRDLITSHRIPTDPALWQMDRYPEFLARRRELLAEAANEFLGRLLRGAVPEVEMKAGAVPPAPERLAVAGPSGSIADADEEALILDINAWVVDRELPEGDMLFEVADPETGDAIVILDLAWPHGLQEGLSQPVALMINEDRETVGAAVEAGYRCFTDTERFKQYVLTEILAQEAA